MAVAEIWVDKSNGNLRYVDANGNTRTLPRAVVASNVSGRIEGEIWLTSGGDAAVNWIGRSTPTSGLHHYKAAYPDYTGAGASSLPHGSLHVQGNYLVVVKDGAYYRQLLSAPAQDDPPPDPDPPPGGGGGTPPVMHYSTSGNTVYVEMYYPDTGRNERVDTISPACSANHFPALSSPTRVGGTTLYTSYNCVYIPP